MLSNTRRIYKNCSCTAVYNTATSILNGFFYDTIHYYCSRVPELYVGLTTGLCGSITTFSSAMHASCMGLYGFASHIGYPVSNYLSITISLFSSALVAFLIGQHFGQLISILSIVQYERNLMKIKKYINLWILPTVFWSSIPTIVLLLVFLPVHRWTHFIYSILFAPFGALTRYFLSTYLNQKSKLPVGTLLANVLGSLIFCGIVTIMKYVSISSMLTHQVLLGLLEGYCGCLTTVSTLIVELTSIESKRYLYLYGFLTFVPIQITYIVLGSFFHSICD